MSLIPIGELSRRTAVHIETIRYYEHEGILPRPRRSESGRRLYEDDDLQRVIFVRHARELGLELAAIRSLLALQERPGESCQGVIDLMRAQLTAVQSRIDRLNVLKGELHRMLRSCTGGRVADCRIVKALNGDVAGLLAGASPSSDRPPV